MTTTTSGAPIPRPSGHMLIGNLLTIDQSAPLQEMMRLARALGPIYSLDMMGKAVVIVSNYSLVDELCDERRFDKAVRGALGRIRRFTGNGLFTADTHDPAWIKARRILLPALSHRAIETYHGMIADIADQLVVKWERLNSDDQVDVVRDMTAFTLDSIGLCGFGYRFNSFYRRDNHPFVDAMIRALGNIKNVRGLPFENLINRTRERQLNLDLAFMNEMVDRLVRQRRADVTNGVPRNDLLDHMIDGVDKTTGQKLDDLNIRYQINTFLIAGHETTSGLLSFAIYFLLKNPVVLTQAYEEVDRILGADTSTIPTFSEVRQLSFISQILKETLRLWPTAPVFAVYPYEDTVIGGQYSLRKGTFIMVLLPMLHRDPTIWGSSAETFRPENFTSEAERARPENAYKPFGNGRRACIGREFALHEAALVLGMILQRFTLIDHLNYELKINETLTLKPDQFWIKVRPRRPAKSH
jgi:cytochrome P450 / NADPH-cytochrome P450 reductase